MGAALGIRGAAFPYVVGGTYKEIQAAQSAIHLLDRLFTPRRYDGMHDFSLPRPTHHPDFADAGHDIHAKLHDAKTEREAYQAVRGGSGDAIVKREPSAPTSLRHMLQSQDPREIAMLKPEVALSLDRSSINDAKKKAMARALHAQANLDSEKEQFRLGAEAFAKKYSYAEKALKSPSGALHQLSEDFPDKLRAAVRSHFGNQSTPPDVHAAAEHLIQSHARIRNLHQESLEFAQTADTLRKLGWATRGRVKAFFAPMVSKEMRKAVSAITIFVVTLPLCFLPQIWDALFGKSKNKAKALQAPPQQMALPQNLNLGSAAQIGGAVN